MKWLVLRHFYYWHCHCVIRAEAEPPSVGTSRLSSEKEMGQMISYPATVFSVPQARSLLVDARGGGENEGMMLIKVPSHEQQATEV